MELSVQLFTGSAITPEQIDISKIIDKLNNIYKRTNISGAYIGWNKDIDISSIIDLLKKQGTDIYFWLPVFSELSLLADFKPLIGIDGKIIETLYNTDNEELFTFCCPANPINVEIAIGVFEKYYDKDIYNGIFLDKIRFPSFIGGLSTVTSCYCDYCRSVFDLPTENDLEFKDIANPMGISTYNDLHYEMNSGFRKLFDYKAKAVYRSLEQLCSYFRNRGFKICLDLFTPATAFFVGQDYHKLLKLTDIVKPMLYNVTNAPAGIPFEINEYAGAFDKNSENAIARRIHLLETVGYYEKDFIKKEVEGIKSIITQNELKTKLHVGIEVNYVENIAPVTGEYIKESVTNVKSADGIIASWNLNTMPDDNITCLLNAMEDMDTRG